MTPSADSYLYVIEPQGAWRPDEVRNVLVYGNCQAHAVYQSLGHIGYRGAPWRFIFAPNHAPGSQGYPGETELSDDLLASVALVLWQCESFENPRGQVVKSRLPAGVPTVRFPAVYMPCLWPFICPEPRAVPEPGFPHTRFPYGDMIGLEIARQGLTGPAAVSAYMDLSRARMPDLPVRLERDLSRMRKTDAACDVAIAGFVARRFRQSHLIWSAYGHADHALVFEIADRVARAAGRLLGPVTCPFDSAPDEVKDRVSMGPVQIPIHPAVAEAFGLGPWVVDKRYAWLGQHWDFHEYLQRYIAYDTDW